MHRSNRPPLLADQPRPPAQPSNGYNGSPQGANGFGVSAQGSNGYGGSQHGYGSSQQSSAALGGSSQAYSRAAPGPPSAPLLSTPPTTSFVSAPPQQAQPPHRPSRAALLPSNGAPPSTPASVPAAFGKPAKQGLMPTPAAPTTFNPANMVQSSSAAASGLQAATESLLQVLQAPPPPPPPSEPTPPPAQAQFPGETSSVARLERLLKESEQRVTGPPTSPSSASQHSAQTVAAIVSSASEDVQTRILNAILHTRASTILEALGGKKTQPSATAAATTHAAPTAAAAVPKVEAKEEPVEVKLETGDVTMVENPAASMAPTLKHKAPVTFGERLMDPMSAETSAHDAYREELERIAAHLARGEPIPKPAPPQPAPAPAPAPSTAPDWSAPDWSAPDWSQAPQKPPSVGLLETPSRPTAQATPPVAPTRAKTLLATPQLSSTPPAPAGGLLPPPSTGSYTPPGNFEEPQSGPSRKTLLGAAPTPASSSTAPESCFQPPASKSRKTLLGQSPGMPAQPTPTVPPARASPVTVPETATPAMAAPHSSKKSLLPDPLLAAAMAPNVSAPSQPNTPAAPLRGPAPSGGLLATPQMGSGGGLLPAPSAIGHPPQRPHGPPPNGPQQPLQPSRGALLPPATGGSGLLRPPGASCGGLLRPPGPTGGSVCESWRSPQEVAPTRPPPIADQAQQLSVFVATAEDTVPERAKKLWVGGKGGREVTQSLAMCVHFGAEGEGPRPEGAKHLKDVSRWSRGSSSGAGPAEMGAVRDALRLIEHHGLVAPLSIRILTNSRRLVEYWQANYHNHRLRLTHLLVRIKKILLNSGYTVQLRLREPFDAGSAEARGLAIAEAAAEEVASGRREPDPPVFTHTGAVAEGEEGEEAEDPKEEEAAMWEGWRSVYLAASSTDPEAKVDEVVVAVEVCGAEVPEGLRSWELRLSPSELGLGECREPELLALIELLHRMRKFAFRQAKLRVWFQNPRVQQIWYMLADSEDLSPSHPVTQILLLMKVLEVGVRLEPVRAFGREFGNEHSERMGKLVERAKASAARRPIGHSRDIPWIQLVKN